MVEGDGQMGSGAVPFSTPARRLGRAAVVAPAGMYAAGEWDAGMNRSQSSARCDLIGGRLPGTGRSGMELPPRLTFEGAWRGPLVGSPQGRWLESLKNMFYRLAQMAPVREGDPLGLGELAAI